VKSFTPGWQRLLARNQKRATAFRVGTSKSSSTGLAVTRRVRLVVIHTDSLRYAEEWHIGLREKTLEDGPDGNKLFAGWEVVSNRNDNTNGGWWKAVDAILLTDHAAVHIRSDYDRGS
jgi:hypothetical protein